MSPVFGSDPNANPRLATAIARAKKEGLPRASIEAAIARGQGMSTSGAKLESVTVEAMVPPSIALVVDSQTDGKARTLLEIRDVIRKHDGQLTPTGYLFDKKGEIVFKAKQGVGVDEILESAVEAGALDLEDGPEGQLIVYTELNATKAVADKLSGEFGLDVESSEIIWDPNTEVDLDCDDSATKLISVIDRLKDISEVQAVYINAAQGTTSEELWDQLQSRVFAS